MEEVVAKKTVSYFSVVEFFGFRLAIPFENLLSLQYLLDAPEAFIDIVQSREGGIQNAARARYPISFPLSLKQLPGFSTSESSAPQLHKVLERSLLFGLFDDSEHTAGTDTSEHQIAGQLSQQTSTPFLEQLCRSFSANNLREHQVELLHWLKEILVLYEQKVGSHLTYIFYPYHPYLLKQVKRFGPLGSFFAQQGAYDTDQFNRTRQALVQLLILQSGHSDYIEDIVRPLLLHEYAVQLASLDWSVRKPLIVVVPYTRGSLEFALYRFSRSQASCYLGSFTAEDEGDAKAVGAQVAHSCFQLREKDELAVAIFQPGETPQQDAVQYFHCTATGIASIK